MVGELGLERPLHQCPRELLEDAPRARQVLRGLVSGQQLVEQLTADLPFLLHRRPFLPRNGRPKRGSSAAYTMFLTGPAWRIHGERVVLGSHAAREPSVPVQALERSSTTKAQHLVAGP